ncbi:MAG: cation:proton antiporter [Candidatus Muiribacteriota bacterium]
MNNCPVFYMLFNDVPDFLILAVIIISGFYIGKSMKFIKLPTIIGFMLTGVLLGPSFLNFLTHDVQKTFSFITELSLGFVALGIGLELSMKQLKRQGKSVMLMIIFETVFTFILVTAGIYLFSSDLPLSLIAGAIASASAPMGTVAIIQEYRARGPVTNVLYSIVGLDDGLGIILFGFSSAFAVNMLSGNLFSNGLDYFALLIPPFFQILWSIILGSFLGLIFPALAIKLKNPRDIYVITVGFVLLATGISLNFKLSFILTNMILGIFIANTQKNTLIRNIKDNLNTNLPLLFVLFFVLGGAHLEIRSVFTVGIISIIYIIGRIAGKIGGTYIAGYIGKVESNIKKYAGLGILSQAGLAIGLSLIAHQELAGISSEAALIGNKIVTLVAATCVFFEVLGPLAAKYALEKSNEI